MDNSTEIQKIKNNSKTSIYEKAEMILKLQEPEIINVTSKFLDPCYEDGVDINDYYFIKMIKKDKIIKELKKELKVKCDCSFSRNCTSCCDN